MIFCTEYPAVNRVGRPVMMCSQTGADSLEDAERVAQARGYTIVGELVETIPWSEGNAYCDAVIARRDEANK